MNIAKNILFLILAAGLLWIALMPFKLGGAAGAIAFVFIGLPCAILAGLIFSYLFSPYIARKMSFSIYYPGDNVKAPPSELPFIRAKIASGKYGDAVADLRKMLEKNPDDIHVITLLTDVFIDDLKDYENAIGLLDAYLRYRKSRSHAEIPLVMRLVDAYTETNETVSAVQVLERESARNYKADDLNLLKKRLSFLKK